MRILYTLLLVDMLRGVSGLGAPIRQLSLWDAGSEKSRKLQEVVDALQEKYGRSVIHRGDMYND